MSLQQLFHQFAESLAAESDRTRSIYLRWLARYAQFLHTHAIPLQKMPAEQKVHAFLSHIHGDQLASSTVNQAVSAIAKFYAWHQTPFDVKRCRVRLPRRLPPILDKSHVIALIQSAPLQDAAILAVFYDCGLTLTQLLALTWSQVNLKQRTISVGSREIQLSLRTAELLWKLLKTSPVFPIKRNTLQIRLARKYHTSAQILRNACIVEMLRQGDLEREICDRVGLSYQSLARYRGHLLPKVKSPLDEFTIAI